MKLYRDISELVTLSGALKKDGRNLKPEDLSIIKDGTIVFDDSKIIWVGNSSDIPSEYANIEKTSLKGHTVVPELVDSHTHLVFGGDRSFEYSLRLNGADYEAIANAGGGILSTMDATKELSEEDLFKLGVERVERIHSYGIGTIEIKSGYGLTYESEKKLSQVIHKLKQHFAGKVQILNTYLAAHAVPKDYKSSNDYLDQLVIPLLKELSEDNIIDFVDIFFENGYFTKEDTIKLFDMATVLGIKTKIHADEFNDNKGAVLATEYNSTSCDHLLCTTADGISALSKSDTVATLLPGTAMFLGKDFADSRSFLDAGCKVALASDYNPGSCHCDNLLMIASLSAKALKLNTAELWSSITLNAAHALGLKNQGAIVENYAPRFSVFKTQNLDSITYNWGRNFSTNS